MHRDLVFSEEIPARSSHSVSATAEKSPGKLQRLMHLAASCSWVSALPLLQLSAFLIDPVARIKQLYPCQSFVYARPEHGLWLTPE